MAGISDLIAAGKEIGIFEFYLPFIVMFAIVYGLLQRAKVFGDDRTARNINLILSIAASMFIMIYTPAGPTFMSLATFLSNLFAGTLMIIVTIIAFLAVVLMIATPLKGGQTPNIQAKNALGYIIAVAAVLAAGVFVSSGGMSIFPGLSLALGPTFGPAVLPGISTQDLAMILVAVGTLVVLYLLTKGGEKPGEEKPSGGEKPRG